MPLSIAWGVMCPYRSVVMIDVSDLEWSRPFYDDALRPIGIEQLSYRERSAAATSSARQMISAC